MRNRFVIVRGRGGSDGFPPRKSGRGAEFASGIAKNGQSVYYIRRTPSGGDADEQGEKGGHSRGGTRHEVPARDQSHAQGDARRHRRARHPICGKRGGGQRGGRDPYHHKQGKGRHPPLLRARRRDVSRREGAGAADRAREILVCLSGRGDGYGERGAARAGVHGGRAVCRDVRRRRHLERRRRPLPQTACGRLCPHGQERHRSAGARPRRGGEVRRREKGQDGGTAHRGARPCGKALAR